MKRFTALLLIVVLAFPLAAGIKSAGVILKPPHVQQSGHCFWYDFLGQTKGVQVLSGPVPFAI